MKPFGVRLAAGAVTILLGAIMAGQAQKNRQSESGSSWSVPENTNDQPPAPIEGLGAQMLMSAPAVDVPDSSNPFPSADEGVQLVQHTEPVTTDTPDALKMELPGLEVPGGELQAFKEPAEAVAAGDAPAATLQLPTDPGGPSAGETAETSGAPSMSMALPSLDVPTAAATDTQQQPTAMPKSAETPAAGASPELSLGALSVIDTGQQSPLNPAGENSDPGRQPGNVLRGGSGNDLRGNPDPIAAALADQPTPSEQPATSQLGEAAAPMLRTIAVPGQQDPQPRNPGNVTPNGIVDSGNLQMQPGPRAISDSPAVRLVTPPNSGIQPGGSRMQLGPGTMGNLQANNQSPDESFNQPAANYGPGNPRALPARGPIAPPLGNQPAARIASLSNQGTTGYQPQTFGQPGAATQLNEDPSVLLSSPGDRRFDGVQTPSIVIHKRAPAEVKVGKPASFVIHVQNVGPVEAMDVRVSDRIPAGMQLVDASPSPVQQGDVLMWELGSMKAGDERTVTLRLVPMQEGELGSVARVTFEAAASVRTISTRPELKIVQRANEKVLIGQQLEIDLEFSNPGTGEATGVVIQEDVPEGLEHPKGRKLDNVIGTLQPGETRRQVLRLRAVKPGVIQNTVTLKGEDGLEATHSVQIEVVSPDIQVDLQGPSRRFLERQATYELAIANAGTADATNVEIAAYLDRGFTFVSTDFEGQYDPARHAVFWSLANLPAGDQGKVPLTLLPVREGDRAIRLEARADLGVTAKSERTVRVDSLAELTFQIKDSADPIEIGGETMYEIKLTNSGSRNDSNVRVQLQLPQGLELVASDADADTDGRGLISFAPRSELAAGSEIVYRVKARGLAQGTHLIKAVVLSDQSTVPVTKEESTMVYADR